MDFGLAHGRAPTATKEEFDATTAADLATGQEAMLAATIASGTTVRPRPALAAAVAPDAEVNSPVSLAATVVPDVDAGPVRGGLSVRLTRTGAMQGTPVYMAPEQWRGEEAEAAADQFGWSVMAWELLHGELPFSGDTVPSLATAVLSGQRTPPRRGRRVPRWLRRVIERGLAVEPALR